MVDNFHDQLIPNIYPINSPDLTPWTTLSLLEEINQHPYNTQDLFMAATERIMANINKEHLILTLHLSNH